MHGLLLAIGYLSLLGLPFFAFFTSAAVTKWKPLVLGSLAVMALISLAMTLDIRFSWQPLNTLACGIWYLGYCMLVFVLLRVKPRRLGRLLTFVGVLPMIALSIVSILGMMVVVFVVGDLVPQHRQAQNGLICTVYTSGNATTRYNYHHVHLTRPWSLLPIVERRLEVIRILDEGQSLQQSCEQVHGNNAAITD
ncbi:hypothetical protein [Alkalimonas sp.]|uniref:hypothetical protein n=1 Tax=Alkalimonas sp. TaxID=1872453 RepID=UPI00263B05CD|nr:hypothetical protein [Alkalimonas sp.]MCC5826254.1 hypothetical protein [Alkalimonas sp.]